MNDVKDNILSVNGWLVFVFLTFTAILGYYSLGYPILSSELDKNFWYKTTASGPDKDILLEVRVPKYVASFEDSEISFTVSIDSAPTAMPSANTPTATSTSGESEKPLDIRVSGKLMIPDDATPKETALFIKDKDKDLKLQENNYVSQILLPFDLAQGGQSQKIWTHVANPYFSQNARVVFTIENASSSSAFTWSATEESPCGNSEICAYVNPYGVFRRAAIDKLLLPPWSNTVIPIAVFALVWLSEKILKSAYRNTGYGQSKECKEDEYVSWHQLGWILLTAFLLLVILIWGVFYVLVKSENMIFPWVIILSAYLAIPFVAVKLLHMKLLKEQKPGRNAAASSGSWLAHVTFYDGLPPKFVNVDYVNQATKIEYPAGENTIRLCDMKGKPILDAEQKFKVDIPEGGESDVVFILPAKEGTGQIRIETPDDDPVVYDLIKRRMI